MSIDYENRVYGLDVLRAYAIFVVVLFHGRLIALDLFELFPFFPWLDGVEMFFVLSGFLIGTILIKIIEKEQGLNGTALIGFWKRRWLRTLPNYYLILLVNFLLVKFNVLNGNIAAFNYYFFVFLQNFWDASFDFYWESWSLSIEEWFYISLPLCMMFFLMFLRKKQAILIAILLLLILPLLYRIYTSDIETNAFYLWDFYFRKPIATRLDAIGYGVLAAYIKFYHLDFWDKSKDKLFIIGLVICFFTVYFQKDLNTFYAKTFSFCIASLGTMFLLPKADSIRSFNNKYIGKIITYVSVISYSLYLVNMLVVQLINTYLPYQNEWQQLLCYVLYWVATFGLSALLHHFYEKPMMNLRDR